MNNFHLILVVTLRCNKRCELCSQQGVMRADPNYEIPWTEFVNFVSSCKARGIRFSTIELSGGEPTLWSRFEDGLRMLSVFGLADWLTFVTNGRDAENVARIASKYAPRYGVSLSSGASLNELNTHLRINPGIFQVDHPHKPCPVSELEMSHPANCCLNYERDGNECTPLAYYKGYIYHCHNAIYLRGDEGAVDFDGDFEGYFMNESRDQTMCGMCLCNSHVWNKIPPLA